jgi:hypothetical protein
LPELPDAKRARYEGGLGLTAYNAGVLTAEVDTARWFEALLAATAAAQNKPEADVAKQASNWLLSEFFGALNKLGKDLSTSPISPKARPNCWRWSAMARSRAPSPSRCWKRCWRRATRRAPSSSARA